MSYFDNILNKRHLSTCPLPLWKLKLTSVEYEELRELLARETRLVGQYPFGSVPRECALFFAEYWRREYTIGSHSITMVYKALHAQPTLRNCDFETLFYDAARKGAKRLGIEIYHGAKADLLNSMLYQGGLPMKLVITPDTNTLWNRFTKGLVMRNINFDELNLGVVATTNQSLRAYCSQLCDAVDAKQFVSLPFYCENEFNPWFQFLLNKFKIEKINHRKSHPFILDWEFIIDNIDRKLSVKYDLKGLQTLPNIFLDQQKLKDKSFFTISVRKNEKAVESFDFINGFSRYEVRCKHPYRDRDVVSLYIDERPIPHISESLDMSTPHLLYRTTNGIYKLGNRIGKFDSVLLVPEGWSIDEDKYVVKTYLWDGIAIKGVILADDFDDEIIVESTDGRMTFSTNSVLFWTELVSSTKINMATVIEPVYDAENSYFYLCHDSEDSVVKRLEKQIEYRSKWQTDWSNTPSYGELFARVKDSNGSFVTPVRFINTGKELAISVVDADKYTCKIRVEWPYGKVFTLCGKKEADNVWFIKKEDCEDIRKIPFEFTPTTNHQNQFTLNVKAPFKDFYIDDINGNILQSCSWIPYSDLDKIQYHLAGMDIRRYQFGNKIRRLEWFEDTLYIVDKDRQRKSIPYEGNLLQLLGTREQVRSMLERTSKNILWASIPVEFTLEDGTSLKFEIKDSPYRLTQEGNKIVVTGNNRIPVNYQRTLLLLKLDEPDHEPITMAYDQEQGYVLPEKIREWGKTIVIGRSRGRICPALVDLTHDMTNEYRKNNREHAIATISHKIDDAIMGDAIWNRIIGWFKRTQKEDVPANSLLELYCVSQRADLLIKLAFQLYCKTSDEEEKNTLLDQLKYMSNDLAFQWFWLLPAIRDELLNMMNAFIRDLRHPAIINMYVSWAVQQPDMDNYLSAMADETYSGHATTWLMGLIKDFKDWMLTLCSLSMRDAYTTIPNGSDCTLIEAIISEKYLYIEKDESYVDTNQDDLDEATKDFFSKYQEIGKPANEQWMLKRVNAIADHLRGNVDMLSQSEKVRRSLIFCYKSTKELFLMELNNRLKH